MKKVVFILWMLFPAFVSAQTNRFFWTLGMGGENLAVVGVENSIEPFIYGFKLGYSPWIKNLFVTNQYQLNTITPILWGSVRLSGIPEYGFYLNAALGAHIEFINKFSVKPYVSVGVMMLADPLYLDVSGRYYFGDPGVVPKLELGLRFEWDWLSHHTLTPISNRAAQYGELNPIFKDLNGLNGKLVLPITLIDFPENFRYGYRLPSMRQSMSLTKSLSDFSRWGILTLLENWDLPVSIIKAGPFTNSRFFQTSVGNFDLISLESVLLLESLWMMMPGGYGWLHEEWHRSVLAQYNIDSFNDIYKMDLFATMVSVSHIKDEDLIRLKKEHPADMVRLSEAGNEANIEFSFQLSKDAFFSGHRNYITAFARLLNIVNASVYVLSSGNSNTVDTETLAMIQAEGTNIALRDAVGFDFTAWVYDLFRPTESYTNRGISPTGVGIDRYITFKDLTTQEIEYLRLQGWLSLINVASQYYLTFCPSWSATNAFTHQAFEWNAYLVHHLTSFGFSIDVDAMYKEKDLRLFASFHNYFNRDRYFPGLELELVDFPISIGDYTFTIDANLSGWMQPKDQSFYSAESKFGGAIQLDATFPVFGNVGINVSVGAKTEGWKAGYVDLGPTVLCSTGIEFRF